MVAKPAARVLFHPDPLRLEEELVAHLREMKTASPWASALVLAPSQRQVLRLRERLPRELGALLGVEILNYQALAYRLLEASGEPVPELLSRAVLERLLERVLAAHPDLALALYATERPGVVSELVARVEELREAGIAPGDPEAGIAPGDPGATAPDASARELAVVFAGMEDALASLELEGWTDRAGLARRAAACARPTHDAVFAYGAYEIVGMHLDLLSAIRPARGLTFLVPGDLEAPAWSYAREFARRHLGDRLEAIPDRGEGARSFVAAARGLYDPDRESRALPEDAIRLVHTQGPEAELNVAARRALALLRDGTPATEIAIVARSLEPYLALAETVFARHGIPVDASGSLPLARHPETRTLLLLLRALRDDFDRRAVVELARSPYLREPTWAKERAGLWRPYSWDRWSRAYGIQGGLEAWRTELPRLLREQSVPRWAREDASETTAFLARREAEAASAEVLGRLVDSWEAFRTRWASCARAGEHAELLRDLARTWIRGWEDPENDAPGHAPLLRTWDEMLLQLDALERTCRLPVPGGGGGAAASTLTRDDALDFAMSALGEAKVPGSRAGAVSFLDAMQARGLVFGHVFLIGFNDRMFPRAARENPLLPDDLRAALRQRTRRPLAVRGEGRLEERLLFAQIVASATTRLTVIWERADAEGKALSVSMALRELARILPGRPSMRSLLEGEGVFAPERVPTEPTMSAQWLAERTGLLLREEAALLAGRRSPRGSAGVRTFLETLDPGLARSVAPGLDLVEAIDFGDGDSLTYDGGLAGDFRWDRPYSASSLEQLGRCPLTFFFQRILRVRPLEEEAEEARLETREVGELVHLALERVYGDLHRQGLLDGGVSAEALVAAGRRALDLHWVTALAPIEHRLAARYPLLYRETRNLWRAEFDAFLAKDLDRLAREGHRLESLEKTWTGKIRLDREGAGPAADMESPAGPAENTDSPATLFVEGVPDRVTRNASGRRLISDYKTSGKIEEYVNLTHGLKGTRLQIPLYLLLAREQETGGNADAEILALGPAFLPNRGFAREDPPRLDAEKLGTHAAGLRDTLRVLASLPERGRFPFRVAGHCSWCGFHLACRRRHFESRVRVEGHPDHGDYFRLGKKNLSRALVAEIRDGEEEEE
jgi:RecB family exonuclease/inactivated superfamily I helicase